jgi:hypothetical protein
MDTGVGYLPRDCHRIREGVLTASFGDDRRGPRPGEHVVRGPLTAGFVLEAFVGGHLLEHASQLEARAD